MSWVFLGNPMSYLKSCYELMKATAGKFGHLTHTFIPLMPPAFIPRNRSQSY